MIHVHNYKWLLLEYGPLKVSKLGLDEWLRHLQVEATRRVKWDNRHPLIFRWIYSVYFPPKWPDKWLDHWKIEFTFMKCFAWMFTMVCRFSQHCRVHWLYIIQRWEKRKEKKEVIPCALCSHFMMCLVWKNHQIWWDKDLFGETQFPIQLYSIYSRNLQHICCTLNHSYFKCNLN